MKHLLVVVDIQKDFVDGALGTAEAVAIVENAAKKIREFDGEIFVTYDTHFENYMETAEGAKLPVPHCIKGTAGHSIVDEVFKAYINVIDTYADAYEVYPMTEINPIKVEKPTFGSVELQNILFDINERLGIEEVTLMGLCTGICVMSNAILSKATLPEVPVNIIADCCACVTPESHKTAIEAMKLCQINII